MEQSQQQSTTTLKQACCCCDGSPLVTAKRPLPRPARVPFEHWTATSHCPRSSWMKSFCKEWCGRRLAGQMTTTMTPKTSSIPQLRCRLLRAAAAAPAAARRLACWPAPAGALISAGAAWPAAEIDRVFERESELFLFSQAASAIVLLFPISISFLRASGVDPLSLFSFRFMFSLSLSRSRA